MMATNSVEPSATEFRPLAPLLHAVSPDKLAVARRQVAELGRIRLIDGYRTAFANGRRVAAFILAEELTKRGIPPCFRLDHRAPPPATHEQKFDLFLADLRWLRRRYPEHVKSVRYMRYRELFAFSESAFHRAAEYVFYEGKRPAWKITGSLSLDQRQQWECVWLRSAPIKKHDAATQAMRDRVFKALQDDLRTVRRTSAFSDDDANATLLRRHALWLCSRMTDGSPAETAIRYTQMRGQPITRQAAAKQLEKVREILNEKRVTASNKKRARII